MIAGVPVGGTVSTGASAAVSLSGNAPSQTLSFVLPAGATGPAGPPTVLSIGTVSRALKNQAGMTETTRSKVREAAMRLDYDFGQLKKGRIRRIAFLLHSQHNTLASSPFFSPVLQGAERLFVLMMLGDERAVRSTYILGEKAGCE